MIEDAITHALVVTAEDGILEGGVGSRIDATLRRAGRDGASPVSVSCGVPTAYLPHGELPTSWRASVLTARGSAGSCSSTSASGPAAGLAARRPGTTGIVHHSGLTLGGPRTTGAFTMQVSVRALACSRAPGPVRAPAPCRAPSAMKGILGLGAIALCRFLSRPARAVRRPARPPGRSPSTTVSTSRRPTLSSLRSKRPPASTSRSATTTKPSSTPRSSRRGRGRRRT